MCSLVIFGKVLVPTLSQPYKATLGCILVSHEELSLKFVRAGGHYHYIIIRITQISLAPGLARSRSL